MIRRIVQLFLQRILVITICELLYASWVENSICERMAYLEHFASLLPDVQIILHFELGGPSIA